MIRDFQFLQLEPYCDLAGKLDSIWESSPFPLTELKTVDKHMYLCSNSIPTNQDGAGGVTGSGEEPFSTPLGEHS